MSAQVNKRKQSFNDKFEGKSQHELMVELLYAQKIQIDLLERTRRNTSNIVWFLIVIPCILFPIFIFLGALF